MRRAGLLPLALALGFAPAHAEERIAIVDVSRSFPPGPYSALRVDGRNPHLVAVGTQDGSVGWSDDSGRTAHESKVLVARSYQFLGLRADPRAWAVHNSANAIANSLNTQPLSSPSWAQTASSGGPTVPPNTQGPGTGSAFGERGNASEFSQGDMPAGDRLFMNLLNAGKPTLRWQGWMSIDDTTAAISDLAFGGGRGKLVVATAQGVSVSDRGRGAWIQAIGLPHPRRSGIQDYDPEGAGVQGLSVAIDPADPSHVLAGTTLGVQVSSNGGESFIPHLDPKMSEEPVYHLQWSEESPERVLALGARSVLVSKDRGRTFASALSTAADLNAIAIASDATYAATHDGLLQVGFDGKIKKLIKDEPVVGVIALGQGLLLVATESVLEVLQIGNPEPVVLKRAAHSDPFLALAGNAEISYALTKNGIFRIGAPNPVGAPSRAPSKMRLSLAETERKVLRYQSLHDPQDQRFYVPNEAWPWYQLMPTISLQLGGLYGQIQTRTPDGTLIGFPFSQASSTAFSGLFGFINLDFARLPGVFFRTATNPLDIRSQNLRPLREDVLAQIRWRYRACVELLTASASHPPGELRDAVAQRLRLEELAAYLEAMAGTPVVALGRDDDFETGEVD